MTVTRLQSLADFLKYPLGSAVFLLLAFPRFDLWFFAWFALIPMLLHISRCRSGRESFLSGFTTGMLFFLGLLYWIPRAMVAYGGIPYLLALIALLLCCLILALFFGVFSLVMFRLFRMWGWKAFLLAPFVWTALEFARDHLALTGFPWGTLGTSQAWFGYMIQIADITGVYGVSFLLVAINTVGLLGLSSQVDRRLKLAWAALVGITFLYVMIYAEVRYISFPLKNGQELAVAGVQGNIREEDGEKRIIRVHNEVYPRMLDQIMAAHPDTRLVIFPENPAPFSYDLDPDYHALLTRMATAHHVSLLINGIHYFGRNEYSNAVYCIAPSGKLTSIYSKIRLVPFAEYIPFRSLFFFVNSLTREISEFTPGTAPVLAKVDGTPIGVFICYEAIFPELVRQFTADGAQVLVNVTNDAWFGRTAAPWQHFQNIILRAVENRRWTVRVANSGISAIIDPLGRTSQVLPLFERKTLTGKIYALTNQSPYVVIGDTFSWLCVLISLLALGKSIFTRGNTNHVDGRREEYSGGDSPTDS